MTLGELIKILENRENRMLSIGFNNPHSYRGYYDQLAFEPAENVMVHQMLDAAKSALGNTFTGYKGGEYFMDGNTEVHLSDYGCCGEEIGYLLMAYMLEDFEIWEDRK